MVSLQADTNVVDVVLGWVEEAFDQDLKAAARDALERLLRLPNGAETFMRECGPDVIDMLYRQRRVYPVRWREIKRGGRTFVETQARYAVAQRKTRGGIVSVTSEQAAPPESPVFAVFFSVEGRWFNFGDMTKAEADYLEKWYAGQADGFAKRAGFFAAIRDGLQHGEQTVRERFTPADIEALARKTGVKL